MLREPKRGNESARRDNRTDGEIDLSTYNKERLTQSYNPDQRSGQGHLFKIRRRVRR
jgi:hypothetical protein